LFLAQGVKRPSVPLFSFTGFTPLFLFLPPSYGAAERETLPEKRGSATEAAPFSFSLSYEMADPTPLFFFLHLALNLLRKKLSGFFGQDFFFPSSFFFSLFLFLPRCPQNSQEGKRFFFLSSLREIPLFPFFPFPFLATTEQSASRWF